MLSRSTLSFGPPVTWGVALAEVPVWHELTTPYMGVWAAGTLVEEQGAKASAQGGAFAARADDPSAIFYNPAGLAFQGTALMAGFSFINEHMKYEGGSFLPYNVQGPVKTYYPLYVYLNYKINDNVAFGFGIGLFFAFQLNQFGFGVLHKVPGANDSAVKFACQHLNVVRFLQTVAEPRPSNEPDYEKLFEALEALSPGL